MTLVLPSMFVLSTRRICWKFGGTTNDIFSENIRKSFSVLDQVCKERDVDGILEGGEEGLLVLLGPHLGAGVSHPDGQLLGSLNQIFPENEDFLKEFSLESSQD